MKTVLNAIFAAFSTFSIIPAPRINWEKYSLRGILCALPLVGAAIGGFLCLYYWLSEILILPGILTAVILTVLPVIISGGIHMDGFADTIDALSSHTEQEKKREILKDPHAGAFAIIAVGCYLLLYFGLCSALSLTWKSIFLVGITHILARAEGAFASTVIHSSKHEGMLHTFTEAADAGSIVISVLWAVLSLALAAYLSWITAAFWCLLCICIFFYIKSTALHEFGGMSGDIAGFGISLTEIVLLLGIVIGERIELLCF